MALTFRVNAVKPRYSKLSITAEQARWRRRRATRFYTAQIRRKARSLLPAENVAAIQLLDSWLNEEAKGYDDEWDRIKQAIDENRLSNRKLFR